MTFYSNYDYTSWLSSTMKVHPLSESVPLFTHGKQLAPNMANDTGLQTVCSYCSYILNNMDLNAAKEIILGKYFYRYMDPRDKYYHTRPFMVDEVVRNQNKADHTTIMDINVVHQLTNHDDHMVNTNNLEQAKEFCVSYKNSTCKRNLFYVNNSVSKSINFEQDAIIAFHNTLYGNDVSYHWSVDSYFENLSLHYQFKDFHRGYHNIDERLHSVILRMGSMISNFTLYTTPLHSHSTLHTTPLLTTLHDTPLLTTLHNTPSYTTLHVTPLLTTPHTTLHTTLHTTPLHTILYTTPLNPLNF